MKPGDSPTLKFIFILSHILSFRQFLVAITPFGVELSAQGSGGRWFDDKRSSTKLGMVADLVRQAWIESAPPVVSGERPTTELEAHIWTLLMSRKFLMSNRRKTFASPND